MDNEPSEDIYGPIRDALKRGSSGKTMRTIHKFQKQYPKSQLLRIFKAFILLRNDDKKEGIALMRDAQQHVPFNIDVFELILDAWHYMDKMDDVCGFLESLFSRFKEPLLYEKYGDEMFYAYAELDDFNKMGQFAMKLYRVFHQVKYRKWAMVSNYMYGKQDAQPLFLTLAERHAQSILAEETTMLDASRADVTQFFHNVLLAKKDYAKAIQSVGEKKGVRFLPFRAKEERFLIECYALNGQVDMAKALSKDLLTRDEYLDDWDLWKAFVNACNGEDPSEESLILEAISKIESGVSGDSKDVQVRGPFLALCHYKSRFGDQEGLQEAFDKYFSLFKSKPIAYGDMHPLLDHVDFLPFFEKNHENALAHKLCLHFIASKQPGLGEEELSKLKAHTTPEFYISQMSKEFGKVGVHVLVERAMKAVSHAEHCEDLFAALILAEEFKLVPAQIRLYGMLAAPSVAFTTYTSNEIKHIQNESLSYLVMDEAVVFDSPEVASQLCLRIRHLEKEFAQTGAIRRVFETERVAQVDDFYDFKRRLEKSIFFNLATFQGIISRLSGHCGLLSDFYGYIDKNLEVLEKFDIGDFVEMNADTSVLPLFMPKEQWKEHGLVPELVKMTSPRLQFVHFIVRSLVCFHHYLRETHRGIRDEISAAADGMLETVEKDFSCAFPSHEHFAQNVNMTTMILEATKGLRDFLRSKSGKDCHTFNEKLNKLASIFEDFVEKTTIHWDNFFDAGTMRYVSSFIESTLRFLVMLVFLMFQSLNFSKKGSLENLIRKCPDVVRTVEIYRSLHRLLLDLSMKAMENLKLHLEAAQVSVDRIDRWFSDLPAAAQRVYKEQCTAVKGKLGRGRRSLVNGMLNRFAQMQSDVEKMVPVFWPKHA